MLRKLTRREFLKLSSLTLSAAVFPSLSPTDLRLPAPLTSLGRITLKKARVLNRPNRLGETIGYVDYDTVVTVQRAVVGEGFYPHNHVWIEIPEGYVYSSWVQPVKNEIQTPLTTLPSGGFFAEVSVPYTEARVSPDPEAEIEYRLYYSVVLKVKNLQTGTDGQIWYEISDENLNYTYWVAGQHLRFIPPAEVAPLSPDLTDKRIVADVHLNWLSAYEGKTEVFRTRIASGSTFFDSNAQRAVLKPGGVHPIHWKRFSRHMVGSDYDLPGVAWVSYFTQGASIHSTYWHNDFGRPRSHGCLNCTPEAAKWLFRWTNPFVAYEVGELHVEWPGGTRVAIEGTPPPLGDEAGS